MTRTTTLTIAGLQEIDCIELEEQLPPDTIRQLPAPSRHSGQYGEPILITAAIVVTAAAVHALSAWLARRNVQGTEGQGFTLTIDPDHKITIRLGATGEAAKTPVSQSDIQSVLEDALKTATSFGSS
jgi:hypothetical protein